MKYWKISMPKEDEMLPLYAQAPDGVASKKKVEKLFGPLKRATVREVQQKDIPEGETVF